jgi:predicted enzyme related to lactoylglutathione lyase
VRGESFGARRRQSPTVAEGGQLEMSVKSICGAILIARDPESLARFYGEALGLSFTREDHGGLAPHWGVDIDRIHFGIHPPSNFKRKTAGQTSAVLTFDVASLSECEERLRRLGAPCIQPSHDEGFGPVASFADPEGNQFEVVELRYDFESGDEGGR